MTDMTDSRKEDVKAHWEVYEKIHNLKAENEKEKEICDKIQIFLIKEIQKITQNKKKDDPYRGR